MLGFGPISAEPISSESSPAQGMLPGATGDARKLISGAGACRFRGSPRDYTPVVVSGNLTLDIDTAGTITLAGQTITFNVGVAQSTAGAITIAGQTATFGLGIAVSTAGALTLSGQSATFNIGLAQSTAGQITLAGQSVTFGAGVAVSAAGQITIAGQSATFDLGVPLSTAGQITLGGQTITTDLTSGGPLSLDIDTAGAITLTGQSVTFNIGIAQGTAGAITLAGQSITAALGLNVTNGQITLAGQTITLDLPAGALSLDIDTAGQITLEGQDVMLVLTGTPPTTGPGVGGGGGGGGTGLGYSHGFKNERDERPKKHLDRILDEAEAAYRALHDAPAAIQEKAAKLVRPFTDSKKAARPDADTVDWAAMQREAKAVSRLLALYRQEQERLARIRDDDDFFMLGD